MKRQSRKPRISLKEQFLSDVKRYQTGVPLDWNDERKEFLEPMAQAMWLGYQVHHLSLRADREERFERGRGHRLIARMRDDGSIAFSPRPFPHRTLEGADQELERLVHKFPGTRFAVYQFVKSRQEEPPKKELETPKLSVSQ